MRKYYAIINNNGVCDGFADVPKEVIDEKYIEIPSLPPPIGKKYENGEWIEVETDPVEPEPTPDPVMEKLDSIEAKIQTNEDLQTFYDDIVKEVGL